MSTKLEKIQNYIILTDLVTGLKDEYPADDIYYRNDSDTISFSHKFNRAEVHQYLWTDLVDKDESSWADLPTLLLWLRRFTGDAGEYSNGGLDVALQDQNTPIIIAKLSKIENETTLSVGASIDDMTITVTSSIGFAADKYLSIFDIISNRFYVGYIKGVAGSVITMDSPLDFAYPSGSFVTSGISNMAVDGSITPVIFGLRNTEETIGITADITRIMIHSHTINSVDLSKFGDIAGGLVNGIVLRKVDGSTRNIFNAKSNGEMAGIMFNFDILSAQNVNQGQNGFFGKLTFAGQNKIGVTIRLAPGEDLQLIVQDDLSSLDLFEITAEGHEVE